jgi:hypothetical protein
MKKLLSILLVLILLSGCAAALAGDEWASYHCTKDGFSTKIPLNALTDYRDEKGMVGMITYLNVPGFPPFVMAHRRPMEGKFKNPQGYLNNTYREFLEEKYPNDSIGINPAKIWEIGGKELIGAKYTLQNKEYDLTTFQLQLIEIRDGGDVEYTAMYNPEDDEELVMKTLNTIVENYRED